MEISAIMYFNILNNFSYIVLQHLSSERYCTSILNFFCDHGGCTDFRSLDVGRRHLGHRAPAHNDGGCLSEGLLDFEFLRLVLSTDNHVGIRMG